MVKSWLKQLLKYWMLLLCLFVPYIGVQAIEDSNILYSNKPAVNWHEAFPLGNGRMGAMVYGGIFTERVQTNEDTFWAGGPRLLQKEGSLKYVKEVRELIASGRTAEAEKIINSQIVGPYYHSYLPFVDVMMRFLPDMGEVTEYRRELDLSSGVLSVSYKLNGIKYHREYFISYPDQALMMRLTCDRKVLSLDLSLQSKVKHSCSTDNHTVYIEGQAPEVCWPHYEPSSEVIYSDTCGMRFQGRLLVVECDGVVRSNVHSLQIRNASEVVLAFVAATSFNGFDKDPVAEGKDTDKLCAEIEVRIMKKDYKDIHTAHVNDFSSLFNRVSLSLGSDERESWPIDERIAHYEPEKDPALTALYFQFGRYLLISSSRPGSQPANLQGIWCDDMKAAWSSNYTLNCNVEINYWSVEVANLSECHLPLMQMIKETTKDGRRTAEVLYGSPGWTVHHNLDLWRTTWPVGKSGQWGIYQAAPAWLCSHIWNHYEFTNDKFFLKEYFPVMEGAAEFYLNTLQKTPEGYLVTSPSVSFENLYVKPDGTKGWVCQGPSADMQMIRNLFECILEAEKVLGIKSDIGAELRKSVSLLAPLKISPRTGELQEWYDDWDNLDDSNGQVGHGWGLIASDMITLRKTPELAKAFRRTLDKRKPMYRSNSGSWTGAFAAGWWVRLEEPDSLQKTIDRHFLKALYPNLTSQFHGFFQIDGNLGFTFAIAEMLLQSHSGELHILPALPAKYSEGYVSGLKACGNHEVDIYWSQGLASKVVICPGTTGKLRVRLGKDEKEYNVVKNEQLVLNGKLEVLSK